VGVCVCILANILCVYDKTSGQMQYVDFFRWVLAEGRVFFFTYCTFSFSLKPNTLSDITI